MNYNWDWGILFRDPYLGWMIGALGWTIVISILAWIIAFSLGSLLGIRSEEHTSELQSRRNLLFRLLLEKKKTSIYDSTYPLYVS